VSVGRVVILLLVAGAVVGAIFLRPDREEPEPPVEPSRFRILDDEERPVAGATVTFHVYAD
jgi:hypothetical protein